MTVSVSKIVELNVNSHSWVLEFILLVTILFIPFFLPNLIIFIT